MPGQTACAAQCPNYLACAARKARRERDISVGGHFAFGNFSNGLADNVEHGVLPVPKPCQGPPQAFFERILRIVAQIAAGRGGVGLRIANVAFTRRTVARG